MDKMNVPKISILYVTYDLESLETVGHLLHSRYQNHRVLFGTDGSGALMYLLHTRPDICIVDMSIHPIKCAELIQELSRQNKLDQTIFIDSPNNMILTDYEIKYILSDTINTDRLLNMIDTIAEGTFPVHS